MCLWEPKNLFYLTTAMCTKVTVKHNIVQAFSKPTASRNMDSARGCGPRVAMESPCVFVCKVLLGFKRLGNCYSAVSLIMQHFVTKKKEKCLFLIYFSHSTGNQMLILVFNSIRDQGREHFIQILHEIRCSYTDLPAQGVCGAAGFLGQNRCKSWGQRCGQTEQAISLSKIPQTTLKTVSAPF